MATRDYKLYLEIVSNITDVTTNPIGEFYFYKDGSEITAAQAANYFYITGDKRYFKLDRSTIGIKTPGVYLYSKKNYETPEYGEFTFSFFYRLPRDILNQCVMFNYPIEGIEWDTGKVTLMAAASAGNAYTYKGRYIHIECCGKVLDLVYDYQSYDGESYIHIAMTMKDNTLRIFINGILYKECAVTSPSYTFNKLKVGNISSGISSKIDTTSTPLIYFDEIAICNRCLWTNSFRVPTRPLLGLFPEIIEDVPKPTVPTLPSKISSAPNFYSRSKTYFDADLDRAEIVRPDAYRPLIHWKAHMYNKHKFNQGDYDYTAKSNWEHYYEHRTWPPGKPFIFF